MAQAQVTATGQRRHGRFGGALIGSATAPAAAALFYPLFVDGFHLAVGLPGTEETFTRIVLATFMMLLMFAVPTYGFLCVMNGSRFPIVAQAFETRARRLAYITVASPTLYCFIGVWNILLSSPLPDEVLWAVIWCAAILYTAFAPLEAGAPQWKAPSSGLRVIHGVTALILIFFLAFHLTNHLFAWKGEFAHSAVMEAGRRVYRSPVVEPVLIAAMLFQVCTGLMLAWRWSARRMDFHKTFQVASGMYLAIYILGHMNAVFTLARWTFGIPTGWDFATGAPNGLIHDPWSARLIPHYALAILLVIGHIFSGLRVVMIAHGTAEHSANKVWMAGIMFASSLAIAIMLAMCGMRL
ncbi:hypothetical protein [Sphingobium sp. HWE2-09]|uniref:hypothetical protein n=1 Tax=Sphingobium sp. HWE2-09 TaxID=3108390 RepID=UPI002DC83144|nr:hypothetical protein [Sphingobium sp. HWE2-09]